MARGIGTASLFDDLFCIDDPEDFATINSRIEKILQHPKTAEKQLRQSVARMPTRESSQANFRAAFRELAEYD